MSEKEKSSFEKEFSIPRNEIPFLPMLSTKDCNG